ncbi:hypothetical protein PG996_000078 [Apiospora saccharicola]|uniref:2EXR domain-containing protein n=1 Tax=Apiospora saccharicola TaxID=335842 RepID=A0ABR1WCX9_9PEZI
MAESTLFPQFALLPPELQTMVWKQFAQAEAASRIVVLHSSLEIDGPNDTPSWSLHIMPPKRLNSPLLSVNLQSRQVALGHYKTRINIFELEPPLPRYPDRLFDNIAESTNHDNNRTAWPPLYHYPTVPAWHPEEHFVDCLEEWVCGRAEHEMDTGREGAIALLAEMGSPCRPRRGCVHLDLETDRFLFYERWEFLPTVREHGYGLRAFSEALLDFKYHRIPFDLEGILARRPPVLRNASAELLPEMMGRIRNVVFECQKPPPISAVVAAAAAGGGGGNGSGAYGGGGIGVSSDGLPVSSRKLLVRSLPRAFSAEGSLQGYQTTREMTRSFFDDIEDKGPAHLDIAQVKLVRGQGDEEDEMGWLNWATGSQYEGDEDEEDDAFDEDVDMLLH